MESVPNGNWRYNNLPTWFIILQRVQIFDKSCPCSFFSTRPESKFSAAPMFTPFSFQIVNLFLYYVCNVKFTPRASESISSSSFV